MESVFPVKGDGRTVGGCPTGRDRLDRTLLGKNSKLQSPTIYTSSLAVCGRLLTLILGLAILAPSSAIAKKPKEPKPAKLKVSGYGLVGNFELKRILRTLELSGKKPPTFGAAFVEDAAIILGSRVKRDGYLKPRIVIRLELERGGHILTTDAELLESPLPDPLQVVRAEFEIQKGVLYHYKRLEFKGLKSMKDKDARSYFMETAILLHPKSARVYTPENLNKGLSGLTEVL